MALFCSLVGGAINYGYHLFLGRFLGPGDYGLFSSFLSFFYFFSVPISALSLAAVKVFIFPKDKEKLLAILYCWGRLFVGAFILFLPIFGFFIHFFSFWPFFWLAVFGILSFLNGFEGARWQGNLAFKRLFLGGIVGAVVKFAWGWFWVKRGMGLAAAVSSLAVGALATFVFWHRGKLFLRKNGRRLLSFSLGASEWIWILLFLLAFNFLSSGDVFLARHFLNAYEAGWYGALANLGRIIFFTLSPLATVFLPLAVRERRKGKKLVSFELLMFFLAFFILAATAVYQKGAFYLLNFSYGRQYAPAAPFLPLFALSAGFYTLNFFWGNKFIAEDKSKAAAFFSIAAVTGELLIVFFFHHNLKAIILASLWANTGLFLLFSLFYFLMIKKNVFKKK